MSMPAGGDAGCKLGCGAAGNQSDSTSTKVWLLHDGGVHRRPYSTVTALGPTPVPCQEPHSSSHCSSTRPSCHGPGNSLTSWPGGRTNQEAGRQTAPVKASPQGLQPSTPCSLNQRATLWFPLRKGETRHTPAYFRWPLSGDGCPCARVASPARQSTACGPWDGTAVLRSRQGIHMAAAAGLVGMGTSQEGSISRDPGATSASHRQSHAPALLPAETTAPTPCALCPLAVARQMLRLGPCPADLVRVRLWPRVNKQPFLRGCCLLPPQPPLAGLAVPAARLRGLARFTPVVAVGSAAGAACHHGWRRAGLKQQTNKKHAWLG